MAEDKFVTAHAPSDTAIPLVKNIFGVSSDFLGELKTWLEQNPPAIPITSVLGFNQFLASGATRINTSQTRTSATYGDLATVGPTITGLSDGKYVVLYGAALSMNAGGPAFMGLAVNGTNPSDDNEALQGAATNFGVSAMTAVLKTLNNGGNNTLKAVYRSDGVNTATFNRRWLIALRYSNI